MLAAALGVPVHLERRPGRAVSPARPTSTECASALAELARAGIAVAEFALGQPSLDEVFLALTGHPAEDATETEENAA